MPNNVGVAKVQAPDPVFSLMIINMSSKKLYSYYLFLLKQSLLSIYTIFMEGKNFTISFFPS